jgi:hypothetical protein
LKFEISGPDLVHLTIVDLPSLIHNDQKYSEGILNMAFKYMGNPRSIILALVGAKYDAELQLVSSQEATRYDREGGRKFRIITHADMVQTDERKQRFLQLARNQSHPKFKLGWHVVRNRSAIEMEQQATLDNDRDKNEKRFLKLMAFGVLWIRVRSA